jgi:hypothetical protein
MEFKLVKVLNPTIDPEFDGEENFCTTYLVANNCIIDIKKASSEDLYNWLCDTYKIYNDDINDYLYKLEENGFKFTWEMIVDIIKCEWFEPEPVYNILLNILSEMEGIESITDVKHDDCFVFINPKTNEKIEFIDFPIDKEINLIEF